MHRRRFVACAAAACMTPGMASAASEWFVPAEEAPHELTFMMWPNAGPETDAGYNDPVFLRMVQDTIADIANAISEFEPVVLLAAHQEHRRARRRLSDAVTLWDVPTDDLWARDAGPIFVVNDRGERAVRHISFNGWGDRQPVPNDRLVAARVADILDLPLLPSILRGEAGGVEQDGHGVLIAHESSWVHPNRNPGLTRAEIGAALLDAYGADRILWAPGVRDLDITDYHIDSLARLTGPGRVLIGLPDNPDARDPFHMAALETHDRLLSAGLQVHVIPDPVKRRVRSPDFVAAYANYYVVNGAVIAPQYGDRETDAIARDTLAAHYPGREIVMLNADALGEIGGGIHCATQQMPKSRGAP